MSHKNVMAFDGFNPLFGTWKLGRQIGSGTDGKVYCLTGDTAAEKSVVKIIRFDYERLVASNPECSSFNAYAKQSYCNAVLKNITDNMDLISKTDKGRFFTDYKEWELRESEDSKSCLLLVRLESLTPLSDFIADFTFTPQEVLRLAICICQSLEKCRDFGYIYPNLKPENIMFDSQGRSKLGDFGTFSCTEPLKSSIAYRRTQQYMAPEFYKGDTLGTTCDTYSLGLVMYALLNRNRLPFLKPFPAEVTMSESRAALERRVAGESFDAPQFATAEVTRIIMKATAYDVKDRYLTPGHMLKDLLCVLEGKPAPDDYVEPGLEEKPLEDVKKPPEQPVEPPTDLFEQYEAEYRLVEENREKRFAQQRQLREQQRRERLQRDRLQRDRQSKPDLSRVVTYNYDEKPEGLLSRIPPKMLVVTVIAILAVIAVIVAVAVGLSSGDSGDTFQAAAILLGEPHCGFIPWL